MAFVFIWHLNTASRPMKERGTYRIQFDFVQFCQDLLSHIHIIFPHLISISTQSPEVQVN